MVVPIQKISTELAPLDRNLTSLQQLERTLEYVSALLNAQLAQDYVNGSRNESTISSAVSAVLVPLAAFCLGVLVTMAAFGCYLHVSKAKTGPDTIICVGKDQVGIVIDGTTDAVTGTRHQIAPPKDVPPTY